MDDPNPRWRDMAPPTFVVTIGFDQIVTLLSSFGTLLHGSTELECYHPVRPGDTIATTVTVTNVRAVQDKAFITIETEYRNQKRQRVARCRQLVISY